MDVDILNREQRFSYNILSNNLVNGSEEQFDMIVTGRSVNKKITVIKTMCGRVNDIYLNTNAVQCTNLRMGTTVTVTFLLVV